MGGAIGEMGFLVGENVVHVGGVQARKAGAQLCHEVGALHAMSPNIVFTAASKAIQSWIWAFRASAPVLVIL